MNGNNGDDPTGEVKKELFKGAIVKASELIRQDGLIAESADKAVRHNQSVIMTAMSAQSDDKDYRQTLKRTIWDSPNEQALYCRAIAACENTGAKKGLHYLLNLLEAKSGGLKGWIITQSFDALTHTTFTTQQQMDRKYKKYADGNKSNSPIA